MTTKVNQQEAQASMNVLLSSVGRRSYLVHYFRRALAGRGKVVATNSHAYATGMLAADHAVILPKADDPEFIERLLGVCHDFKIRLLFSLHDWEAPYIAAARGRFSALGVIPVVSDPSVLDICLDKFATYEFGLRDRIRVPKTTLGLEAALKELENGAFSFPLVIKPRRGQGSICIETVFDESEMRSAYSLIQRKIQRIDSNNLIAKPGVENIIIQERVLGDEYGIDVINDLHGNFAACLVKRKLAMRAGETDAAETVDSRELQAFGRLIGEHLGHIGLLDADVMVNEQGPCLLEANCRFGGHYPFSHEAGANIPAAIIAWAQGKSPDREWLNTRFGSRAYKDMQLVTQPGQNNPALKSFRTEETKIKGEAAGLPSIGWNDFGEKNGRLDIDFTG